MLLLSATVLALLAVQSHAAEAEYVITNVRLLSGDTVGVMHPYNPGGINNSGQATGYGYLVQDQDVGDGHTSHPCFYDPDTGHVVNLGDMDGNMGESGQGGNGYAINDSGWVTGRNYITVVVGEETKKYYRAFYWKDLNGNGQTDAGEMNNLGVDPAYTASVGWGMNNVGQVVGTESRYNPTETRGWLWTDANGNNAYDAGEKTILEDYSPVGINDAGQIAMGANKHAYRWQDANSDGVVDAAELLAIPNATDLGGNVGTEEYVDSINQSGDVAGIMKNAMAKKQGYYWSDANGDGAATTDEVQVFGEWNQNTFVRDMNDPGQIVGGTYHWRGLPDKGTDRRAYIWDSENGIRDLNELIYPYELEGHGEFMLSQAEGINNRGQIAVSGHFEDLEGGTSSYYEQDHLIILTPLSSLLMGDANDDGRVDVSDLGILATNYGTTGVAMWADADFTGDHKVDVSDLGILATNYGTGATVAVPEPAMAGLLLAAACGLCLLQRTRRSTRNVT